MTSSDINEQIDRALEAGNAARMLGRALVARKEAGASVIEVQSEIDEYLARTGSMKPVFGLGYEVLHAEADPARFTALMDLARELNGLSEELTTVLHGEVVVRDVETFLRSIPNEEG